ncbi:TPA: DUF4435 domain-containing protein [Yersinia enterocolitica]|nr:DUF4435 domain-containing protein [Yersinia enterocolitica]HDL7492317.1 DUF4435 domain-containing protein [Yersinia enterocolitica]
MRDNKIPRATISEIRIKYVLEPSLEDIYVEGDFDKDVIKRKCKELNQHDRVVYNINTIDIPMDILMKYNLSDGNKQRVIALAKELSDIHIGRKYLCVVDKDLDHWFGLTEDVPRLFWTNYCSMELYFFSEEFIKDLLIDVLKTKIEAWGYFYHSFVETLKILYALRLTDFDMKLGLGWLSFERCLGVDGTTIVFNYEEYINRVLNSSKLIAEKNSYLDNLDIWKEKLNGDPRLFIRGHDFVQLLVWAVKEFKGVRDFWSEVAIERLFVNSTSKIENVAILFK